jgi:hypothetical protein
MSDEIAVFLMQTLGTLILSVFLLAVRSLI